MKHAPHTSQADPALKSASSTAQPAEEAGASEADARTLPSNAEKDPDTWTTGDESMTGAQASYLKTLSEEAGEPFEDGLTKAEASKRIDALQAKTGRGRNH